MLQVGDSIQGRYRVLGILGQGGTGVTYEAQDIQSGQKVALKALWMRHLQDWKALELFEREARVLKQLDHPGIPDYIETLKLSEDQEGEALCLVQTLVQGRHLGHHLEQRRPVAVPTACHWAEQLLHILIYLHERPTPTLHRDIKPHNIIERPDGSLSLVDFGAVRERLRPKEELASTLVGTYGYMAPEQLRGEATAATDLYGLGATLVALLTATDPARLPHKRLKLEFRDHVQLPEGLARWLDELLAPAMEDRPASARLALERLRELLKEPQAPSPGPAHFADPEDEPPRPKKRRAGRQRKKQRRKPYHESHHRKQRGSGRSPQPPEETRIKLQLAERATRVILPRHLRGWQKKAAQAPVWWWPLGTLLTLFAGLPFWVVAAVGVPLAVLALYLISWRQELQLEHQQLTLRVPLWRDLSGKVTLPRHQIKYLFGDAQPYQEGLPELALVTRQEGSYTLNQGLGPQDSAWLHGLLQKWRNSGQVKLEPPAQDSPPPTRLRTHSPPARGGKTLPKSLPQPSPRDAPQVQAQVQAQAHKQR